jgi:hypothetical protein
MIRLGFCMLLGGSALAACAATTSGGSDTGGSGGGDSSSGVLSSGTNTGTGTGVSSTGMGAGGGLFGDGGFPPVDGGPGSDCSEEAKLIYIISQTNNFYSFHPPTLTVTPLGILNCPNAGFATPFSMAVDRQGIAWVLFSDGRIFHVDVKTVACSPTNFVAGQQGFTTFGMGFVSDAVGSDQETLYVGDYLGKGLGKIDTTTMTLTFVGPYDALQGAAEMTGTGDARLYGFFQYSPIIIAEIDKSNAHIISQAPQPTVNIGSGWAFAFWGGDFWLFTSPNLGNSQIDRYQPSTGMTTTVKTNLGTNIVGAGVSTCAPYEPVPF